MNWLNKTSAFIFRNWIFSKRSFFSLAELLFWPVIGLLSIGLMADFFQFTKRELGFVLSGSIAMGVLQVTQLDVSYSLLFDIWSKSIKHIFLSPIGVSESLLGSWIVGVVRGFIVFLILLIFSTWAFDFEIPSVIPVIIFLLGLFLSGLIIGANVCILILCFGQRAEITAWSLATLLMLFCGIYYPVDQLPLFFNLFAKIIPITYFLEYFRSFYDFEISSGYPLLKGFSLGILYFIMSLILMRKASHRAKKTGIILRLSE
ncbi:MAG: ABC transporter permease [Acidobacteriota bacterium]